MTSVKVPSQTQDTVEESPFPEAFLYEEDLEIPKDGVDPTDDDESDDGGAIILDIAGDMPVLPDALDSDGSEPEAIEIELDSVIKESESIDGAELGDEGPDESLTFEEELQLLDHSAPDEEEANDSSFVADFVIDEKLLPPEDDASDDEPDLMDEYLLEIQSSYLDESR